MVTLNKIPTAKNTQQKTCGGNSYVIHSKMKTFDYYCGCCGSCWSVNFENHVMEYDDEAISYCPECDHAIAPNDENS